MSDAARDPVDVLVEQFLQRYRAGAVTVATFCAEHPDHAATLRDLLPALLALEDVRRERASSDTGRRRASVPQLERLGDFRIVREVGRGGMGVVFEALQESLGRKVALKVLPQASLLTGNQLLRFQREAQIAARLHHSNIVPVFGSGESDGYHWYAMQFIAGRGLDHWRAERAAAPPAGAAAWREHARLVARLGLQAAAALHHAHGQGTLHRDIKPGNLLLEPPERLWVTDFGLAKALEGSGLTHSGDVLGTLQYMAPEQFAGVYDVRSEIYALGVTLYELAMLRPAFAGSSRTELMERIRSHRPEALRRACPDLPEDLVVVIEKAMARDPVDRYPSAQALQADLQAFLDDRPIAARRLSAAGVLWRWCRRNRGMAMLAASTMLAIVGAGVTGWVAYGITGEALTRAAAESSRAEANLRLALTGLGEVFDTLVGPDPTLALEEDPDTGEPTVVARTVVDPASVALLRQLLRVYEQFAAQNTADQTLPVETARAYRRVGAIHVRLGRRDNLDEAQRAYEQALARLATVGDRDVARDVAAVHVDYGRLLQRRGEPLAAAQRYLEALALLEGHADGTARAVRFERAQVHYLLAWLADPMQRRGLGRSPPPGGPGGGPGEARRGLLQLLQGSRQHLQQAMDLVAALQAAEADNRELLTLHARCLLLASRLPEPGRDRRGERERVRTPEQQAQRQQGLDLLRALVARQPAADQLRYELAENLVPRRRRDGPRPPSTEELAALREARSHAAWLVEAQPLTREYQALRADVGLQLGLALRVLADGAPPSEQAALRAEAVAELQAAAAAGTMLLPADGVAEPGALRPLLEARRLLAQTYASDRRRADAGRELQTIVELVERHGLPFAGGPGGGEYDRLRGLLENLGLDDLLARLQRLPVPEAAGEPPPGRNR